ncbi:putative calcium-binding protein CML30-like [Capsicum annuum]|nr:putative calcium-binding protein CML30-like [Capsicum annuum]
MGISVEIQEVLLLKLLTFLFNQITQRQCKKRTSHDSQMGNPTITKEPDSMPFANSPVYASRAIDLAPKNVFPDIESLSTDGSIREAYESEISKSSSISAFGNEANESSIVISRHVEAGKDFSTEVHGFGTNNQSNHSRVVGLNKISALALEVGTIGSPHIPDDELVKLRTFVAREQSAVIIKLEGSLNSFRRALSRNKLFVSGSPNLARNCFISALARSSCSSTVVVTFFVCALLRASSAQYIGNRFGEGGAVVKNNGSFRKGVVGRSKRHCCSEWVMIIPSGDGITPPRIRRNREVSKDVLLKPKSSVTGISSIPFLSISDVPETQKTIYGCSSSNSYSQCRSCYSDSSNARCIHCQNSLSRMLTYVAPPGASGAVAAPRGFVKDVVTYMVMDNLVVKPMSTISSITLLNKFNVKDVGVLQEVILSLPMANVVRLLKEKGMINYGCLPGLYNSVENLSDNYIQSKNVLLKPSPTLGMCRKDSFLLVDDVPTIRTCYGCTCDSGFAADSPSARCPACGLTTMSRKLTYVAPLILKEGVAATGDFVKEAVKYMVMDDLEVSNLKHIFSFAVDHFISAARNQLP